MLRNKLADKMAAIREEKSADDRGFTLIELLVVVVIIGILIAIAIPLYLNYQRGAHDKSAQSDLRGAVSALQQCFTDNSNAYPTGVSVASNVGTPAAPGTTNPCANDTINLSSGTSFTYTAQPTGCDDLTASTMCTSYTASAYNSGGNRGSTNPYTYSSSTGGNIQ